MASHTIWRKMEDDKFTRNVEGGMLNFSDVTAHDAGQYTCQTDNGIFTSTSSKPATLLVEGK